MLYQNPQKSQNFIFKNPRIGIRVQSRDPTVAWSAMSLTGVHLILIILGLDLIQTKHFLVETEDGMGWDKPLGTDVPTAEDLEKVKI